MSQYDDLFMTQSTKETTSTQTFDKDAWAERKQAERNAVYEMANATALSVISDGARFQAYLDVQARFDRYSATNALLILAQMPSATQVKDFDGWKNSGVSIKKNQKSISILEPGPEYERDDGTIGTAYNVKKVFDISQTTARTNFHSVSRTDNRTLLRALIHNAPVPLQMIDELPNNAGAYYDHRQQLIFVRKGMDAANIFRSVAMELAHAEIARGVEGYCREDAAFTAYSASYMLCKQYSMEVSGYRFSSLPERLKESNPQSIRGALTEIRDTAANISTRMALVLEQTKSPKTSEQER